MIYYKKFEIVSISWGISIKLITQEYLKKEEIEKFYGINIGVEFSNDFFIKKEIRHMGIILSNNFLNEKSESVLVAPITSLTNKHKEKHKNKVILLKKDFNFLDNDSVIILNKLKEIDKSRINKHIAFIDKTEIKNKINDRLKYVFMLK